MDALQQSMHTFLHYGLYLPVNHYSDMQCQGDLANVPDNSPHKEKHNFCPVQILEQMQGRGGGKGTWQLGPE